MQRFLNPPSFQVAAIDSYRSPCGEDGEQEHGHENRQNDDIPIGEDSSRGDFPTDPSHQHRNESGGQEAASQISAQALTAKQSSQSPIGAGAYHAQRKDGQP